MPRRLETLKSLPLLTLMAVAGCATVSGMKDEPRGEGVARIYWADFNRVVTAARDSVMELGLTIDDISQVSDRRWRIIATADVSAFSWGELVRIVVEQKQEPAVTVRVLTRRRLAVNVTAKDDWAPDIYARMNSKLGRSY